MGIEPWLVAALADILAPVRKAIASLAAVVLIGGGGALAFASGGGSTHHGNAGHHQYHGKPGCGPDKSDGVAGGSGRHEGQPPKDHNRGDCPDPPGHLEYAGHRHRRHGHFGHGNH